MLTGEMMNQSTQINGKSYNNSLEAKAIQWQTGSHTRPSFQRSLHTKITQPPQTDGNNTHKTQR